MKTHKIACQLITFGDLSARGDLMVALGQVKECGYDGFECGLGSVEQLDAEDLRELGLEMAAVHIVIDLRDGTPPEALVETHRPLIEKAAALGCRLAFNSSMYYPGKSEEDYRREALAHNLYGRMCKESGVDLCFHNHHWEFKAGAVGFETYFRTWDPEYVHLVPDVGWVTRSDVDPVAFLCAHRDQVKALHFKEFTFDDRFTELGRGVVEFPRIYDYIKSDDLWIIAEQDTCSGSPVDSIRENANYLFRLMRGEISMPGKRDSAAPEKRQVPHPIACELITYGEIDSRERMLWVLRDVKDAGYDGFECGIGLLAYIEKSDLDEMGLALHASHTGMDFAHSDDLNALVEGHRPQVEKSAALGAKFLFISGSYFMGKTEADFIREAHGHNLLGQMAGEYGMKLCFHNHHWEFKKHALGFKTYFKHWEPDRVWLVPDVGWIARADVDPVVFLAEHKARVQSVHFKDFTFDDHFTELGRGIVDLQRIYRYISGTEGLWIVAEQDACAGDPSESVRENLRYLRQLMI